MNICDPAYGEKEEQCNEGIGRGGSKEGGWKEGELLSCFN